MSIIPIHLIGGKQFMKARLLRLPVVYDGVTFRMPSSSGGEGEHVVRFDSLEEPLNYSCTCRAGQTGTPCWAAARALEALNVLAVNQICVTRRAPAQLSGDVNEPELKRAEAGFDEDGEMMLVWSGQPPEAGQLYDISN